jgi:predicted nucleic acid-binding protein
VIFVDTNIFYNFLFETELSDKASAVLGSSMPLVTSFTVLNELVYISTRKLAESRYNVRTYREFRKFIAAEGYTPFERDLELIFSLLRDRDIQVLPDYQALADWRMVMDMYRLLPNDAVLAITCTHYGIEKIATFDGDFKRVDFLEVVR